MKKSFVTAVLAVKRPIKKCKKPERDIQESMLEATIHVFMEECLC